jgi:transcriptional regulator with XRE-family HTH domain
MKEIFKKFRNQLGLTQKELANKLDVSRAAIAQIESGNNNVSYELLHKIKNVFNVNLEELEIENGYLSNINNNTISSQNEKFDINSSKKDSLNRNTELFKKKILDSNMSLLYSDNMKTIYFTASLLQNHGYSFKEKEKEKMFFYEDVGEFLSDLHTGKEKATDIIIENLDHIIRFDMFRFIGNLMWKAQKQVGFSVNYRLEDIFN